MDERIMLGLMADARAAGAEFSDMRVGRSRSASIDIQDGRAEKVHASTGQGLGVRVLRDGAWGFSSSCDVSENSARACLSEALEMARAAAPHVGERSSVAQVEPARDRVTAGAEIDPACVPLAEKVKTVSALESAARGFDGRIANTRLSYFDSGGELLIANTFGTFLEIETVRTKVFLRAVAVEDGVRQFGFESAGRLEGWELVKNLTPEQISVPAARRAVELLGARPAPSGNFPIIFDSSVTGLFVHEAFGHNCEADLVWAGESIIAGKMGEKVGSGLVTIVDDATIPGAWGSYAYDSEGVAAQRRVLVEKGVVKNFMHTLETAAHFGVAPNGSGRAESTSCRPIVRMSNTFIEPGDKSLDEMIRGTDHGLLLKGAFGGYVSTETGQFTCSVAEAWLIRNGELQEMMRDVSVSGMVLEALANVDMVGSDFALTMPGTCGKNGQGMPVDNGGPAIRVKSLVVGGQ